MEISASPQKPPAVPLRTRCMPNAPEGQKTCRHHHQTMNPTPITVGQQAERMAANVESLPKKHFRRTHQDVERAGGFRANKRPSAMRVSGQSDLQESCSEQPISESSACRFDGKQDAHLALFAAEKQFESVPRANSVFPLPAKPRAGDVQAEPSKPRFC